jgi:hypothetical protein
MALVKVRFSVEIEVEAYSPYQGLLEAEQTSTMKPLLEVAKVQEIPHALNIVDFDEAKIEADRERQKTLQFSTCGDILFVENFWNCECNDQKTYRKLDHPNCPGCGYSHTESEDARGNELLASDRDRALLTPDEITQIEQELAKPHEKNLREAPVIC